MDKKTVCEKLLKLKEKEEEIEKKNFKFNMIHIFITAPAIATFFSFIFNSSVAAFIVAYLLSLVLFIPISSIAGSDIDVVRADIKKAVEEVSMKIPILQEMKPEYEIVGNFNKSFDNKKEAYEQLYIEACKKGANAIVLIEADTHTHTYGSITTSRNIMMGNKVKGSVHSSVSHNLVATLVNIPNYRQS